MRNLFLRIGIWIKAVVIKWPIEHLTEYINLITWSWAKKQYDKLSQPMNVQKSTVDRLEVYKNVDIQKGQGAREGSRKRTFKFFAWMLILADGVLYTWGIASIYGYGPLSDIREPGDWAKLLFMSFILTLASVLGPTELFRTLLRGELDADKVKYKLPEQEEGASSILKYILWFVSILGLAVTIYIGYERGVTFTRGKGIVFFLITPLFISTVAALFKYLALKSGRLYDAFKLKEKYHELFAKYHQMNAERLKLRRRLADQAASIHMKLIIMVRRLLKVPHSTEQFPKKQSDLRDYVLSNFNQTIIDDENKGTGFGLGMATSVLLCIGFIALTSMSGCKGLHGGNKILDPDTSYDVKVLVDISGSTSDQKWQNYKEGIFNIIKSVGLKSEISVYAIDEAAYTDPGLLMEINLSARKGNQGKVNAFIRSLPDSLRPPFKRQYEADKMEDIIANRAIPFFQKLWPLLSRQMDSIKQVRARYAGHTNIIGALKKIEPEFTHLKDEDNSSFSLRGKMTNSYLFVFSDMVQSSKDGVTFEKPYGITDAESKHYLETLKADNQIPQLDKVKVIAIGKGVFNGGPLTDESIDNIYTFWQEYFKKTQANLAVYTSLDNVNNIDKYLH